MIPHLSESALILAPHGRDARIAAGILSEAGLLVHICPSLDALMQGLQQGAGLGLITEESLRTENLNPLAGWLQQQPEWSDFPFILLTHKGGGLERNPAAQRFLDVLGNVTFLERPFHPTTLISLVRSGIRGRRRQYDARSRLEELHRGSEKYRSLFESIDAGFCIVQPEYDEAGQLRDFVFQETNPAFEQQTGLANTAGLSIRAMVPGDEWKWIEIFSEVAKSGKHARFEYQAVALGDRRWFDVYAFGVGARGSQRVAVLFNDISQRRSMEQALRDNEDRLRRLNETLEARVVERTSELAQAQDALRQSQKLEAIGQLTGGVAHDFNNLLMAIMSSMTLLRRRVPDDPALHRLIDNALQATDRGAALTQRMLAFARRQDLSPERLNIVDVVRDIADLVQRTLGPSWPLELQFPATLSPVVADQNQLELALVNLALNARDAMPEGGVIRVAAEQRRLPDAEIPGVKPGWYVGASLIDTGHGMDAATLLRATEPFFTTKGVGKGTGLGLSMIYGLAEQLGGTFTLRSAPGQGTKATLWLPAATEAQPEVLRAVAEPKAGVMPVKNLKILAVDDDGLILMNTAALLEDLGHVVIEAASGSEALARMEDNPDIDLLITDQAMPNMTGIQLIRKVFATRPDLPVIIATGYGEAPREFEGKIVKIGKPFSQNELADALSQAVCKRGSRLCADI